MTNERYVTWKEQTIPVQPGILSHWTQPVHSLPLADSDIHVWSASLALSRHELDQLFLLLSPDERTRSERFYFERDRNRFIAGRGLLRILLGAYAGKEPSHIRFDYSEQGKPALRSTTTDRNLEFNLSHSNGLVLYVFSRSRRVGIDIEFMKPMEHMDDFAMQYFSAEEAGLIHSLSGSRKVEAFYRAWTYREAYLKAHGTGLAMPIDQVRLSPGTNEIFTMNSPGRELAQPIRWRLELFQPCPGYQAALVVEGRDGRIVFHK